MLLLHIALAACLRIRRSEPNEIKVTSGKHDIKSTDERLFGDDLLNTTLNQKELDALNEIPSSAAKNDPEEISTPNPYTYSVTSNIISDLPPTTPLTPSYSLSYSQTPSPFPFYGSPTPSLYPTIQPYHKPTFIPPKNPTTQIPVKSLPLRNPYASTLSPKNHYYPTPRSYFPSGYPNVPNYSPTLHPSFHPHLQNSPQPKPYNRPALTFLDEAPISQAIEVKHRSFTPQPRIREPKSEDTAIPQFTPKLLPTDIGPPQLALLTIGLQSQPPPFNKSLLLPEVPSDSNTNKTEFIEFDNIINDEKLTIENLQNSSPKLNKSISVNLDNQETAESASKDITTDIILSFPQQSIPGISDVQKTTETSHDIKELNISATSSKPEVSVPEVPEVPHVDENANPAQLNISRPPQPSLTVIIQPSNPTENDLERQNSEIFSDPSLSFDIHQDVPRSPKAFDSEDFSSTERETIPFNLNSVPSSVQENFRIVRTKDKNLSPKVSPRPIRIKIPQKVPLVEKPETTTIIFAEPLDNESYKLEEPRIGKSLQFLEKPETTTIIYAESFDITVDNESDILEKPRNGQSAPFPDTTSFLLQTSSKDSENQFSIIQPLISPLEQGFVDVSQRNILPEQLLANPELVFKPEVQKPRTDLLTQQPSLSNPALPIVQQNPLNAAFQLQQNTRLIQPLLRNPSDYIFQPQQPIAPTNFNIDNSNQHQLSAVSAFSKTRPLQPEQFAFQTHFNLETSNPPPVLDVSTFPGTQPIQPFKTFQPQQPAALTHFNVEPSAPFRSSSFPDTLPFNTQQDTARPIHQPERDQKSIGLPIFQANTFNPHNPQQNEITQDIAEPNQGHQTLFQSINREAIDRPVRKKQSEASNLRSEPKSDAFERLVSIAGADWDSSLHTGKIILSTSSSNFSCPGLTGDFPDPDTCSVYYQCAEGVAHRHTCQEGLLWNMAINMCDWQNNVDCEVNKGNKEAPAVSQVKQEESRPFTVFG